MEKCVYCNGSGFIGTGYVEREIAGHKAMYPYTQPCYCKINFNIGQKFGILSPVNFPLPVDTSLVHKIYGNNDFLFFGSEEVFLYLVKAYFMHGFSSKNYLILEGGTIVEQYNVPRESNGDWLTTAHLNQYDMLAVLFTTSARYNSLKDCVLEVIKNRSRIAKPTWVYSASSESLKNSREYSEELETYFKNYKKVNLLEVPPLKGFKSRKAAVLKTERTMNDNLANI